MVETLTQGSARLLNSLALGYSSRAPTGLSRRSSGLLPLRFLKTSAPQLLREAQHHHRHVVMLRRAGGERVRTLNEAFGNCCRRVGAGCGVDGNRDDGVLPPLFLFGGSWLR